MSLKISAGARDWSLTSANCQNTPLYCFQAYLEAVCCSSLSLRDGSRQSEKALDRISWLPNSPRFHNGGDGDVSYIRLHGIFFHPGVREGEQPLPRERLCEEAVNNRPAVLPRHTRPSRGALTWLCGQFCFQCCGWFAGVVSLHQNLKKENSFRMATCLFYGSVCIHAATYFLLRPRFSSSSFFSPSWFLPSVPYFFRVLLL